MPSTVEELSPNRVKLTVEVPFAELKPSLDKAYTAIAQQVTIPGFRKGKVPAMVIDQRFGRGMVLQEAINDALPGLYTRAVAENELIPMGQPEVEVTKLEDGDVVEFTAELDVRPEFEVPDLGAVKVEVEALSVSDELVEEQLEALQARFASQQDVERPAAEGDVVTVNLSASRDGAPIEEAQAEGLTYSVGHGGMLDGLDETLTGMSAGESADFSSTLVGGNAKGTEADVHVDLLTVAEREMPELDDDFAQLVSEFDTVAELRDDVVTRLTNRARLEQAAAARDAVLEAVVAELDVTVPAGVLAAEQENRRTQIKQQLAQAGMTLEQFLASDEAEEGETEESFWAGVDKRSTDALTAQLLLDKVADRDQIGVDQNELIQHIMRRAQQSNTSPQQEMQHMQEHNHATEWMTEIRRGKALAQIVTAATVTDSDGNAVELDRIGEDGALIDLEAIAAEAEAAEVEAAEVEAAEAADVEATEDDAAAPAEDATARG